MKVYHSGREWTISSRSPNGNSCVAVAHDGATGAVTISNSNDPSQGEIQFTREEWVAFIAGVKDDEFAFTLDGPTPVTVGPEVGSADGNWTHHL